MADAGRPRFSVVIPTYNRASSLTALLDSLADQAFRDFETVVIDDGSTDATTSVLEARKDPALTWRSQPNRGPWVARNHGAALARGEWLVFLDDDDGVEPEWLADFAHDGHDERDEDEGEAGNVGLASCAVTVVDSTGNPTGHRAPDPQGGVVYGGHVFLPGAFATRKDVFEAAGGYDETVTFGENYELGIRLVGACASAGLRSRYIERPNLRWRARPPGERAALDPVLVLQGSERMLAKHERTLLSHPEHWSDVLAVAGVSAARAGDWPRARRYLRRSAVACPRRAKAWLRVGAAWVRPIGRRVWSAR